MELLFIGNSYTYYNDLPGLFQALARENGQEITCYSVTCGGRKLYENTYKEEDEYARRIRELASTHRFWRVILQEHSLGPIVDYPLFTYGVTRLMEVLEKSADGFLLYETWGRGSGSPTLIEHGWTGKGMSERLAAAYRRLGAALSVPVSPVGENFQKVLAADPSVELYDPDRTHPSKAGSCLAALTHYRALFGVFPEKTASLELPAETLALFREIVSG